MRGEASLSVWSEWPKPAGGLIGALGGPSLIGQGGKPGAMVDGSQRKSSLGAWRAYWRRCAR